MHQQMGVVLQRENDEFSAAPNGCYYLAFDEAAKRFGRWFRNRAVPEDPGRLKALAFKAGGAEVIYNGLYFRKFGHI
jgi:hypothetical protein